MAVTFKTRPRKKRHSIRRYEKHVNEEEYYRNPPPIVLKVKTYLSTKVKELWERKYSTYELKENPNKIFEEITQKINKLITQKNYREIVILSPFLHKNYVKKFIEYIHGLKKKYGKLDVVVVTRPVKFVYWNRNEHYESIKLLKEAGITVCFPSKYAEKFHAKAIVLDTEIVIAGSINYLAPSYDEIAILTPLTKILLNPVSARTLVKIFKEIRCLKQ